MSMHGETVIVHRVADTGEADDLNNEITAAKTETVKNVLVEPGNQSDATDATRPDGITVAYVLYFPRTYRFEGLRGATVEIGGVDKPLHVIGDPRPIDGGIRPTRWNLKVELEERDG